MCDQNQGSMPQVGELRHIRASYDLVGWSARLVWSKDPEVRILRILAQETQPYGCRNLLWGCGDTQAVVGKLNDHCDH